MILKTLKFLKGMTKNKKFEFKEALESLGFQKDEIEPIWFRPRDGFSVKIIGSKNGKEMFSLMNFKRQNNRHIATAEAPYTQEEFSVLMSKFSVI